MTARNNYIFLSLLKRTEEGSPHQAAQALYNEEPKNPQVVSTHALSLFLQGRASSAVTLMEGLQPEQLRDPSLNYYYGIFLAGAKRTAKAEEVLKLTDKSFRLLPEEEALRERVMKKAPPVKSGNTPSSPSEKKP